jgi:hypothetical protein
VAESQNRPYTALSDLMDRAAALPASRRSE